MIEGTEELVKTAVMQYMSKGTFCNRSNFADQFSIIQHDYVVDRLCAQMTGYQHASFDG